MDARQQEFLKFALPLTLFVAGWAAVIQGFTRAGAVLVIAAGAAAILFRAAMVAVQNRSPWASAELRPRLFVLWGIGVIIVGIAWLIAG